MHIIIGLVLAAFVLWLWLAGHWFGRVLAFLVLGVVIGSIGFGAASSIQFEQPKQAIETTVPECIGQTDPFCLTLQPTAKERATEALPTSAPSPALQIIGFLIGGVVAWFIASLPAHSQRRL